MAEVRLDMEGRGLVRWEMNEEAEEIVEQSVVEVGGGEEEGAVAEVREEKKGKERENEKGRRELERWSLPMPIVEQKKGGGKLSQLLSGFRVRF